MSYYGYKERDLSKSQINWADVTKGISDKLMTVSKERQKKKDELAKGHSDNISKINQLQRGADTTANQFTITSAIDSKGFLNEYYNKMISGEITPNEYKIIQQNVMASWDSLDSSMKNYQATFAERSSAEGKGNEAIMAATQKFLDFSNKKLYFDEQGNGYYASLDKDGKVVEGSSIPVSAMNNIFLQKFDTVDLDKSVSAIKKNVGRWSQFTNTYRSVESARKNPAFNTWIGSETRKILSSDQKIASILMDYLGYEYNLEGEPGENEIKMRIKGGQLVPELTEKQKQEAESVIKNKIEMSLDYIEKGTKKVGSPPPPPKIIDLTESYKIQAKITDLDVNDPFYAEEKNKSANNLFNALKNQARLKGYDVNSLSLDESLNIVVNGVSMGDVSKVDLTKVASQIEKGVKNKSNLLNASDRKNGR